MTDYTGSNTPADQRDSWRTPPELFSALDAEFCFQLDAAASVENTLCRRYITAEQNTLVTPWRDYITIPGHVWLNPPYSNIAPFVAKAAAEKLTGVGCVMLLPADTSVGWYRQALDTASEIRFITASVDDSGRVNSGRIKFVNPVTGAPQGGNNKGSMLVIWPPWPRAVCQYSSVELDSLMQYGARRIARREAA
ncbi:phage N-6-adenine-methyltransferase [Enterobacteriaceae bacterium YMB-R22]|uniref:phage N-6-adenine-methyltransferase n=1 Tax=Tenebrionicola larvae TaxID=2815733 RepID=UPI002013478A|nr:phage N-6-adenine-methyltransferase [Tenebrionicola larvae]MBV4411833.1 phage N-6-adenine-methyltransferase [Tenebrionicola larvae]